MVYRLGQLAYSLHIFICSKSNLASRGLSPYFDVQRQAKSDARNTNQYFTLLY